MNNITIAGTLGRDAELRHMPDGTPVASFSVADSQGREKPTIWWSCQIFGKRAESLSSYLVKSQQVTVVGTVTEREWTDKEGGKRKNMEVRVTDIALQGGKRDEAPRQQAQAKQQAKPQAQSNDAFGGANFDDDIPF